jgi:hypothetical protein
MRAHTLSAAGDKILISGGPPPNACPFFTIGEARLLERALACLQRVEYLDP